ncbi:MAG: FAD-dependent monooxygenase [Bacteroidota bacterium]
MSRLTTPICIVGAGPAGSTLALFLAQMKIPHVLVEKASFPRDKVCGDGLTLEVMHTLREISPKVWEQFLRHPAFKPCWGVQAIGPNGTAVHIDFDPIVHPFSPLYTGKRKNFDYFLWEQLDLSVTQRYPLTQVRHIERIGQSCLLTLKPNPHKLTEIKADIVIGADGSSSIVARSLGEILSAKASSFGIGIRGYAHHAPHQQVETMNFHFLEKLLPGYFWSFPLNDEELNMGIYLPADWREKNTCSLPEVLDQLAATYPIKNKRGARLSLDQIRTWGLPLNVQPRKLAGPNYLLLGDAGALIEPFTGKGIGMAMVSAKVAAQYLKKGYEGKITFSRALLDYDKAMKRMYQGEYRISRYLYRAFAYTPVINTAAWFFSRNIINQLSQKNLQKEILKWQY